MAYLKTILVVVLGIFIHAQSLSLPLGSGGPKPIKLQYFINSTTTYFNGTDPSKPVALSNLQAAMWSDKPTSLALAADGLHDKITSLPTTLTGGQSLETKAVGEVSTMSLIYSKNESVVIWVGPKQRQTVINDLWLNMWLRK